MNWRYIKDSVALWVAYKLVPYRLLLVCFVRARAEAGGARYEEITCKEIQDYLDAKVGDR